VADRQLFAGQGLSAIDAKGRVAIPACLRSILDANSAGRSLVIARHPDRPCIIGHDRGWLDELNLRIKQDEEREKAAGRPFDYYAAVEDAFGQVEELPYDPSGRFILPPFFKHKGDLSDLAFFYGSGPFFAIWNPRFLLENRVAHSKAAEGAEYFMREKGLL
jgi:MraZ protein